MRSFPQIFLLIPQKNYSFFSENFLKDNFILREITLGVCREAAKLRREYLKKDSMEKIDLRRGLADFIIVATATLKGQKVLTFDKRLLKMLPEYTETVNDVLNALSL